MRFLAGTILINAAVNALCFGIMLEGAEWYGGDEVGPGALLIGGGLLGLVGAVLMIHGALMQLKSNNRPMYWPYSDKR